MKKEIKITLTVLGIVLVIFVIVYGIFIGLNKNSRTIYPYLSENAMAFTTAEYIDTNDDNVGYLTIEYNGRKYMPYGTLQGIIKEKNIDKCSRR